MNGILAEAGRIRADGGPGLWSISCGSCRAVKSLPRGLTREDAAATARREGHTYYHPLGWLCGSCRFSFGVAPTVPPRRERKNGEAAPWRRVILSQYNVVDGSGRRLGRGELLSCGHTLIAPDGGPSGNRRRRCLDCLHVGAGPVT